MILLLLWLILSVSSRPEAEYQLFKGFDPKAWEPSSTTVPPRRHHHRSALATTPRYNFMLLNETEEVMDLTPDNNVTRVSSHKMDKTVCPEQEQPSNIGPYEVPTQRDLVLLTRKTLHKLFGSYHEKVMLFLEDIKKANRATTQEEKKCAGNKAMYRNCVKHVSTKCETITKSLTTALEMQRQDVIAFGQKEICSLEEMKEDPVKLIKQLASEEASLEFALPGFLRLLNACSVYCMSPVTSEKYKAVKPTRKLTNTDLVVRHFLIPKNYKRLMNRKYLNGKYVNQKYAKERQPSAIITPRP